MLRGWSLKTQILTLILGLMIITLIILGGLTYLKVGSDLHRGIEQKARSLSSVMAENVGPGLEFQDSVYIGEVATAVFADNDVYGVAVFGSDTDIVYLKLLDDDLWQKIERCNLSDTTTVEYMGEYCLVESPILSHGKIVGCLWLVLSEERIVIEARQSLLIIIMAASLVLILAAILGMVFVKRIVRPIKTFELAADRVGFGDMLSPIEVDDLQHDFVPLGGAFNAMQEQLKGAFSELARSRDQLEVQVAERTRELSAELAERKKAEQALLFTQFSVDHSADPAYWMGPEGRFTYVNDAACRTLGYSREELLALSVFEIDQVMTREMWPDHWGDLRKRGSFMIESVHRRKDESTLPVEITANFMEFQGLEYNCAFARDISERVLAEERKVEVQEQLKRAERMESLGILAGGVAHDLNNMLGPVVGYTELLLMSLEGDEKTRKRVERISRSAKGAADVIQDLLALARRGRYEMAPLDLNEVVEHFLDSPAFIQMQEEKPGITVVTTLDERIDNLIGSEPHLAKVVMNLIVNAFDAMADTGGLEIKTSIGYVDQLLTDHITIEPGRYVMLRVKDTGAGIDPEDIARIFEPYYSKKKMGKSGSGLGLSVVYGIVKDHSGYYDILSEPGEGTEFVLYFPTTAEKKLKRLVTDDELKGSERILIVDDSQEQREVSVDLLGVLGYQVKTVSNGHEAIEFLRQNEADLVALDMIMEDDFDGLDTYREIIRFKPGQRTIIVSGYSSTERVQMMQKLGAGEYVRKPFTRKTLGQAIRNELDRQRTPAS